MRHNILNFRGTSIRYLTAMKSFLFPMWLCFFAGNLYAADIVVSSTQLPVAMLGLSDIDSIGISIDSNNNTFTIISAKEGSYYYFNDKPIDLKKYGTIWNTFLKDGRFHFYIFKDGDICIYKFTNYKDIKLVSSIDLRGSFTESFRPDSIYCIIPLPQETNSYYLLIDGSVFPASPAEFIFDFASGGHGIYYVKPFLAEVRDGKVGKPKKLKYGGKRDETFYTKGVIRTGEIFHFLGLRQQEKRAWGPRETNFTPVILQHAAYNLKTNKVTQTNPIYTDTPRGGEDRGIWYRYDYGTYSMDAMGDNAFVAFSWVKLSHHKNQIGEKYAESNIFYWDCIQGKTGKAEKIADGFNPVVKADSLGNVHLLYVNNKANLMHKIKRKGAWQQANVLVNRVTTKPWTDNIAATFDKDNNLHVVYQMSSTLVHSVFKVN